MSFNSAEEAHKFLKSTESQSVDQLEVVLRDLINRAYEGQLLENDSHMMATWFIVQLSSAQFSLCRQAEKDREDLQRLVEGLKHQIANLELSLASARSAGIRAAIEVFTETNDLNAVITFRKENDSKAGVLEVKPLK